MSMNSRILMVLLMLLFHAPVFAVYNEPGEMAPAGDADFDAGLRAVKAQQWAEAIRLLIWLRNAIRAAPMCSTCSASRSASWADCPMPFGITSVRCCWIPDIAVRTNTSARPI